MQVTFPNEAELLRFLEGVLKSEGTSRQEDPGAAVLFDNGVANYTDCVSLAKEVFAAIAPDYEKYCHDCEICNTCDYLGEQYDEGYDNARAEWEYKLNTQKAIHNEEIVELNTRVNELRGLIP